ncbi:hypothetical protein [Devosia sp.]|uniref:hypothetical protein n=1 Tax=Devosia sp. TaxID=1871048 RepID=UPI00262603F9|nr:hypothetical protein [Devosia sp.]
MSILRFHSSSRAALLMAVCSGLLLSAAVVHNADAAPNRPAALTVTDEPLPPDLQNRLYSKPAKAPDITMEKVLGDDYYNGGQTVVGRKVDSLRGELNNLQKSVSNISERLTKLESGSQSQAAEYFANVATIDTQLQSGTTPGNPRLIKRLSVARNSLEGLAGNVASLNDLAIEVANADSVAGFLLESVRATYSLSGAIEEDHAHLAQLEDTINNTAVIVDRLQNNVNDDITRTVSYLGTERNNLRTLSLAVTTGDLFGKSLSNRPFSGAQPANFSPEGSSLTPMPNGGPNSGTSAMSGGAPRPLVKIRFDKANVAYEQPVYMAVNEALQRYPNARFELVAVHPAGGNSAESTIESTRARRNAEKVLRSMTQMGVTMDRIDLSYMPSADANTSEVHLYIR